MLKKLILFSLALFIISCDSDNLTNSGDDTFDIGITENKEWVYDRITDPNVETMLWLPFKEETSEDTTKYRIYRLTDDMTLETAKEYGRYIDYKVDTKNLFVKRNGFGSRYYSGRLREEELYVKYFSVDAESWVILEDENDTTHQSGLYEKFSITLKGENLGSSTINFEGSDSKALTSRVITEISRIRKYPDEEPFEDRERSIVEMTIVDGIGVYETNSEFIDYPHDSDSIVSKSRMKLIEYREK